MSSPSPPPAAASAARKRPAASEVMPTGAPATFFCYLLQSHHPSRRSHRSTYIGFTVHPLRRLRQHNGELAAGGARFTSYGRPWSMLATVYGFPTMKAALQFEWAWQFPRASRLVRALLDANDARPRSERVSFKPNAVGQVNLLYSMLALQPWCHFGLHVRFLREEDYQKLHVLEADRGARARIPAHMDVSWGALTELDWAATLTKRGWAAAQARGAGDTKGEESMLDVQEPATKPSRKKPGEAPAAAAKGKGKSASAVAASPQAAAAPLDDDVPDDEELNELDDELALVDAEADIDAFADEDGASGWPASQLDGDDDEAAAAVAVADAADAAAFASSQKQLDSDFAYAQALAASLVADGGAEDERDIMSSYQESLEELGFRFDEESHAFVSLDPQQADDDECDVDMTLGAASPAASSASAAAASSHSAAAASSSAVAASSAAASGASSSRSSSCQLCHGSPLSAHERAVPQLSHFGFDNLLTVCPHCSQIGHLLCFQRSMQGGISQRHAGAASDAASSSRSVAAVEYPLLPTPAPCPFCQHTLVWCTLVENSHRFHAPSAAASSASDFASASAAGAAASSSKRTLAQYFSDAEVQFKHIAKLQLLELIKQQNAAKAAKKLQTKTKGKKGAAVAGEKDVVAASPMAVARAVASPMMAVVVKAAASPAAALSASQQMHRNFNDQQVSLYGGKENGAPAFAAASATSVRGARKRRSRSLTPTKQLASQSSPSASTISTISPRKRAAVVAVGAAAGSGVNAPLKPMRSLSLPFIEAAANRVQLAAMHKDRAVAPSVSAKASSVKANASLHRSPDLSASGVVGMILEDDEDDGEPVRSQRSAGNISADESEVDLTRPLASSLWDRCAAKAAAGAPAAASVSAAVRPMRSLLSQSAARAPSSPIHISESEDDENDAAAARPSASAATNRRKQQAATQPKDLSLSQRSEPIVLSL